MTVSARRTHVATELALGISVLAFVDLIFNYFWVGNGIHQTGGALLVVVSTALLALALGAVLTRLGPRWLQVVLEALIVADFVGTAAAAYLLEAWILLALVALAALACLFRLVLRPQLSPAVQD